MALLLCSSLRVIVAEAGGQSFVYLAWEIWARTGADPTLRDGRSQTPCAFASLTT